MSLQVSARSAGLSMRLRLHFRLVLIVAQGLIPGLAVLAVAGLPHVPLVVGLAVVTAALVVWLGLAVRGWRECVIAAADTLEIRGVIRTRHIPVSAVTGVRFSRGALRISVAGSSAAGRHGGCASVSVPAVRLGAAHWTGRRTQADEFADALAAAAGLPPLPPRTTAAGPRRVRSALIAGTGLLAAGAVAAGLGSPMNGAAAIAVRAVGWCLLYASGLMLFPAVMIAVDGFFGRWRPGEVEPSPEPAA
jgi:hypothetical protein